MRALSITSGRTLPSRRARLSKLLLPLLLVLAPLPVAGQVVLGPFDDATVVRRGTVRLVVAPLWTRWDQRFADGLGGTSRGTLEPLASDFNLAEVGGLQLPRLGLVDGALRSILGGAPPARLTLGNLETRFDRSFTITNLSLELGVSRRLTLGALMPVVQSRTDVSVTPNATLSGNVGINPGYTFPGARVVNAQVVSQISSASQRLQGLLTTCAGSPAPECTAVNADRARAQALVAAAGSVSAGIQQLFGTSAADPGLPFAPVERGALHTAVGARLSTLAGDFLSFLGAPTGSTSWIDSRPVGAAPVAYADFQRILADTLFGIAADSLVHVDRSWIGDMEVGARVLLFDSFGGGVPQQAAMGGVRTRLTAGVIYRLGSTQWKLPGVFADPGTGDAQNDIEGLVAADVALGRRFWFSVLGRYTNQLSDVERIRVPTAAHDPFPGFASEAQLERNLGDAISLTVSPRLIIASSAAIGASWLYYNKTADSYRYSAAPPTGSAPDPDVLGEGSALVEQRLAAGATYSTMSAFLAGRARLPLEVSLIAGQTVSGAGNAPRQRYLNFVLRVYRRLF
ncbi:MAG: hypothetical protein ACT4OZ_07550 [Gemmatimonadota bacterium]